MLKEITEHPQSQYLNLWEQGLAIGNAYYLDYSGEKKKAVKDVPIYRTFVRNRHIDYVLRKREILSPYTITIDMRTLAFTDHCAVIVDFNF